MAGSQEGNVWFFEESGRAGPFTAMLDQLEPDAPPYLQVANGGSGYPPPRAFTDGAVTSIHFQPATSGPAQDWSSWQYTPGTMFDRFDDLG